jgi:HK97 family phage portal protein
MTLLQRLQAATRVFRVSAQWQAQSVADLDRWIEGRSGGGVVDDERALSIAAWFSGVQQICQTVASLPLFVYRLRDDRRERHEAHPVFPVLRYRANPLTTAFAYKETAQLHLIHAGNHYAYIQRDDAYRPRALWPLNPWRTKPQVDNGIRTYEYRPPRGQMRVFEDEEIFHVAGLAFDGTKGYSILQLARESLTTGTSQERFANRFYENGTNVGAVLRHPSKLSQDAHDRLSKSLREKYSGAENVNKTMILEEGMEFEKLGMDLVDAQFLESRVFTVQEIARWLNMPPHKLKDLSRATYDNIQSEQMSYYVDTLRPWLERWESAIDSQLLNGQSGVYSEFLIDALFRADIQTRYEAYTSARNTGWMNADEIRQRENLPPLGGEQGSVYWMPENMRDAREFSRREEQLPAVAPERDEAEGAVTETENE